MLDDDDLRRFFRGVVLRTPRYGNGDPAELSLSSESGHVDVAGRLTATPRYDASNNINKHPH